MRIDSNTMVSITEANQNFSRVARLVDEHGSAVILKNNVPRYLIIDADNADSFIELTDDEKIDIVAKRILNRYLDAFKELAK